MTREHFRVIEPLPRKPWKEYAANSASRPDMIYVGDEYLTVAEARKLRDWLTRALPEEKS